MIIFEIRKYIYFKQESHHLQLREYKKSLKFTLNILHLF